MDDDHPISKLSPFIFDKVIRSAVGTVKTVRHLRNGHFLLEVASAVQSRIVDKLANLAGCPVTASPHRTRYACKGVIRCAQTVGCDEQETLRELYPRGEKSHWTLVTIKCLSTYWKSKRCLLTRWPMPDTSGNMQRTTHIWCFSMCNWSSWWSVPGQRGTCSSRWMSTHLPMDKGLGPRVSHSRTASLETSHLSIPRCRAHDTVTQFAWKMVFAKAWNWGNLTKLGQFKRVSQQLRMNPKSTYENAWRHCYTDLSMGLRCRRTIRIIWTPNASQTSWVDLRLRWQSLSVP